MPRTAFIRSDDVARQYRLPSPMAREIVNAATSQALRRSVSAWVLLVGGIGGAGWLWAQHGMGSKAATSVLMGTMFCWWVLGRLLAGPGIREAAAAKAARIHGPDPRDPLASDGPSRQATP